ncbi:sugar phosphate isomerase/epimerase [Fodinisporobacter ferrooxydans]|uniref:Sugar phosphate isomerase/epimerase n=1 Tax=Fodinisporobacter ferrooxydans TaxID=2901836 RepID=A0ABY4CG53_9BACL|nr:sugar phosphate isomerase/epimerase [Alicyclobacillaceae bacterium MYW30-H2]
MKIAYSNLACPEWSMEEVMTNAVKYGYDGVELRLLDGEVIRPDIAASARRNIVRLAKENGLDIVGIGASTRFAMSDAKERQQNVNDLLAYIELAAAMEVPIVRTFGGVFNKSNTDPQHHADCVQRVADSLNQVVSRAEELGIDVLLETHDEFSSSYLVKDALKQVSSDRIGALWDTHHPYRMGETVEETYENLKDRLRHVHLKDAKRNGDGWDLVLFGLGEVPVQQVVKKLQQVGYNRYLTVEWERKWHPEIAEAHLAIPQHIEILKGYLD